jgi:hypothetical protein
MRLFHPHQVTAPPARTPTPRSSPSQRAPFLESLSADERGASIASERRYPLRLTAGGERPRDAFSLPLGCTFHRNPQDESRAADPSERCSAGTRFLAGSERPGRQVNRIRRLRPLRP